MIDSHTHLFLCQRPEAELLASAREAGVERMLNVGLGGDSNLVAIAGAERNEVVFATVGRHPTEAAGFDQAAAAEIARLARHEKVRAIGETGLDYYRESASRDEQRRAFAAQTEIAIDLDLPIVIHARDSDGSSEAIEEVFATLDARAPGHPVILHCFSAPQLAGEAADRGWRCSFAGNATYPSSDDLRAAAAALPEELILVETDAPYLTPQEMRGESNEPANVVATARALAEVRGVSYGELEETVEGNARAVFGW
ncbi:MAG TPA: TatD family hydrolase [Solirubrobacterales bacterium]|nr:TatD family hydrolase [Solirubrobacterales bacterium]